jgi:hypothetical protein
MLHRNNDDVSGQHAERDDHQTQNLDAVTYCVAAKATEDGFFAGAIGGEGVLPLG